MLFAKKKVAVGKMMIETMSFWVLVFYTDTFLVSTDLISRSHKEMDVFSQYTDFAIMDRIGKKE